MTGPNPDLLTDLLKQVSRSFYLTLRVLPGPVAPQIGLAYLLARATDTIADTEILSVPRRLEALDALRTAILDDAAPTPWLALGEMARHQGTPGERVLLERLEEAVEILRSCDPEDRARIREVLAVITSGQELDLRRFHGAGPDRIEALVSDAELEDYTYRVAGCVGEFWTKMCVARLYGGLGLDTQRLLKLGVSYGQGLQLVNILRDIPRDLRQGRCYLPLDALRARGLVPVDLLRPETEPAFRPVYDLWLDRALGRLADGWQYTQALPWRSARVRLACAWPVLIGVETLGRLRQGRVLDPGVRLKAGRGFVKRMVAKSLVMYPFAGAWGGLFERQVAASGARAAR